MDPRLLALVSLRSLAQLLTLQGELQKADSLTFIANAIGSGRDVDQHLQAVADALEAGDAASWGDIHARIQSEAEALRNR